MNQDFNRVNSMSNSSDPSQHLKELLNVGKSPIGCSSDVQLSSNGMKSARGTSLNDASLNQSNGDMNQDLSSSLPGVRSNVKQNVVLHGDDSRASFPLYGQEIIITPSGNSNINTASTSSSQVKCTPVVKYDWESKYYIGNMVAVNKYYVVYVLKTPGGYGVRVLNRMTSERALLKGYKEMIVDLAFSHYNSNLLACVDRMGALSIWKLFEEEGSVRNKLILSVDGDSVTPSEYHRVVWGPYLPEDPSSVEPDCSFLGVCHDSQVELWDIEEEFMEGLPQPVAKEQVQNSYIMITNGHEREITDLAVAPDGSVMATASLDGTVKFWSMQWESSEPPRRLHKFEPHDRKPVSSLIFCDNHKTQDPSVAYWRFLLTGADFNSEIKLWCTVSWKCLQVVRFLTTDPQPCLKVCLDQSASFLIASDIKRKVFYILKLFQDSMKGHAHFSSLSEFVLNEPMLNFCVATAGQKSIKAGEEEDEAHLSGEFSEEGSGVNNRVDIMVNMFCVFSRALQDLHVRFKPNSSIENDVAAASLSTTSREDIALQDGLSDMSFSAAEQSTDAEGSQPDLIGGISPARPELQPTPAQSMTTSSFTSESNQSTVQPFLMTPDDLRSGSFNQKDLNALQQLRDSGSSSASSFTQVTRTNISTVDDMMSPQPSTGGDGSLTITPSSLQDASPNSSRVLTPSQVPLPLSTSVSRDTSLQADEEDTAPKSPPNTPEEGDHSHLSHLSVASAEDLAERLHQHPRLEKRLSDSSAEVAKILQNEDHQEAEQWNDTDRHGEDDTNLGPKFPKLEIEVKVADLVDLSYSPVVVSDDVAGGEKQDDGEVMRKDVMDEDTLPHKETEQRNWPTDVSSDGRRPSEDQVMGASGLSPEEKELGAATFNQDPEPTVPVHPTVATIKQADLESSSATGSDSDNGGGDIRKGQRRRKPRGSHTEIENQTLEEMREIKDCLNKIMANSQHQQEDMKKLRQDIIKSQQSNSIIQSMKSRIEKLEKSINDRVDGLVEEQTKAERQRFDAVMQDRQNTEKQRHDQVMETLQTTVKQSINQAITQNLAKTIQTECVPEITVALTSLTNDFTKRAAEKLAVADQQMKESIGKLIKNRNFGETIAQNTAQMMSNTITQSYRDNFYKNVIPAFDNACKNMFQQMATSFQKGTDTCIHQMQGMMQDSAGTQKQDGQLLMAEIRSLVDSQQKDLTSFKLDLEKNMQKVIVGHLQSEMERLQEMLAENMQQLILREIQPVLKQHQDSVHESLVSVVRSQAATPVPQQADIHRIQNQISDLLRKNKINDAFQVALNAADLRALMYACEQTDMDRVFGEDCALEQPVLLSLIHQLSHDLTTNTELKIKYLDECMMAIDEESTITKGHLPNILDGLINNINLFMKDPSCLPQHSKSLKRIRKMASKVG